MPGSKRTFIADQSLLSYYAHRFLGAVAPMLPPRTGYAIFSRMGDLAYRISTVARENVYDNLRHVLGPQADPERIRQVARQVFRNQACNYYDLFRAASLSAEELERLVTVHGLEHVDQALSAGKGVIVVTAHFGASDLVGQIFGLRGYPVTVAAEHLQPEKLYQYIASLRGSKGIKLIPIDSFLRPLFRALHNNEIVGLAADRNLNEAGTWIEFFGAPALLPDGHIKLALRTGAKLIPAFSLRRSDRSFEAFIEPPLALEHSGDLQQDVRTGLAKLVAVLEKYIGQYPEQWVMFYPIWKRPEH